MYIINNVPGRNRPIGLVFHHNKRQMPKIANVIHHHTVNCGSASLRMCRYEEGQVETPKRVDIAKAEQYLNRPQRSTTCEVYEVESRTDARFMGVGVAVCSKEDNFEKAKGRKVSMRRALQQCGLDKSQRIYVWNQYLNNRVRLCTYLSCS